jgi:uncharacterized protein
MSLIDTIRKEQLAARKGQYNVDGTFDNKLVAALLTTLLGEVGLVAKNAGRVDATDEEVVATVKKFIKNNETITGAARVPSHDQELDILKSYLPKQLTREDLAALRKGMAHITNKGDWMKFLKETYAGRYDGKIASEVF